MKFEDWHTHNSLCKHAIGSVEDYIIEAIKKKLNIIGVSGHFPYEFLLESFPDIRGVPFEEYAMKMDEINGYLSNLEHLKEKNKQAIQIRIGFEIEFIENQVKYLNNYLKKYVTRLDYIIGSVHFLRESDGLFAFDDLKSIEKYKNYKSIDIIFLQYYKILQSMIKSTDFNFDIIGHFDLPKKFNKKAENKEIVMNEVLSVLELIKKRKTTIELNTSGFRRPIKEQYPSLEILNEVYNLDISVLLGSDAHHPDEIAFNFKSALEILKKIGFTKLARFENRRKSFVDI
ncbi:MAG: histidinol-phosphatase HisJ [Promethearchaeota archaeon]